jgi:hypothetical protein
LSRCLDGLPKDKYRKRAQAELTDHLLTLTDELEAGGYSPEEAKTRATELMGAPEELNEDFRAEWVRRASSLKYCLIAFLENGFYAAMVNFLSRWLLVMPLLLGAGDWLYDGLLAGGLPAGIIFTAANYLPGLWFAASELHKRFALHPRRKGLLLCGLAVVWLMEFLPLNLSVVPAPLGPLYVLQSLCSIFLLPLMFCQFPAVLLAWETPYSATYTYRTHWVLSLLFTVLFALFYRKKNKKTADKT